MLAGTSMFALASAALTSIWTATRIGHSKISQGLPPAVDQIDLLLLKLFAFVRIALAEIDCGG
jgi:hypothetical protein